MVSWSQLVDALPDPAFVVDARDRVTHMNERASELLDWPSSLLVGQSTAVILPSRVRATNGTSFYRDLASTGDARPRWAPIVRRDGVEVEVAHVASRPIAGCILVSIRRHGDTVPVEGPPTVRAAQETVRLIFDNAPLAIFYFDARGVVTACNDAFVKLLGSSKEKILGLSMTTLPDPRIRACVDQALGGRTSRFEGEYRSVTGGRLVPAHGIFAPCLDDDGRAIGGIGIFEDETDRRNIQRALSRSERMAALGTLAAGVAHEMNTPIAYLMASIELARQRVGEVDMTRGGLGRGIVDALDNAYEGSKRVRDLVRDLRTFVRDDSETTARPIQLVDVLDSAAQLAEPSLPAGVELVRDYHAVPLVLGVESKLVQVFVNLLVNAAQSYDSLPSDRMASEGSRVGGRITIGLRQSEEGQSEEGQSEEGQSEEGQSGEGSPGGQGSVVVEIRDHGRGIAPDDVEHVFEPFWTRRPIGQGSGLGLSICHGIVTSLGGQIEVDSELGTGTTVRVSLPVSARTHRRSEPSGIRLAPTGPARILIIEDEPRLATTLKLALEPDHHVVVVTTGQDALSLLESDQQFDMILSDLMMPGLTGKDVFEQVAAQNPELAARFVFMTGGAFTSRMQEFLASIDNPRLDKPFEITDVEETLRRMRSRVLAPAHIAER